MKLLVRVLWTPLHVLWSAAVFAWFLLARRHGVLVFTHFQDMESTGRDPQMGPLVDALLARGDRLIEWTLVPLARLLKSWPHKRRMFVSHAAPVALAWLMCVGRRADKQRQLGARVRVARWMLRLLKPRVLYLIDESGSGQPLLRAARQLGIPAVGVQHGDFLLSRQYGGGELDVEPADALCVWSSWFRDRLLSVSPIYGPERIRVSGRLRYGQSREPSLEPPVRVLVVAERDPQPLRSFVAELEACSDINVELRPHPAGSPTALPSLATSLLASTVVVGRGSSALLEAMYYERPVVVCGDDPAGLAAEGLAGRCDAPAALPALCRELAGERGRRAAAAARSRVWDTDSADVAQAILGIGDVLASSRHTSLFAP